MRFAKGWIGLLLLCAGAYSQELPRATYDAGPAAIRETPPMWLTPVTAQRAVRLNALPRGERETIPPGSLRATGRARPVVAPRREQASLHDLPDGRRVLRFELQSPDAAAVRVHFQDFHIGTAKLWIYANGVGFDGPYTSDGPHGDGEFWSSPLEADTVTVEYLAEAGSEVAVLPFTVDQVLHSWSTVNDERASTAPCQREVACESGFLELASAIASYDVVKDGFSFVCSGALINTRSGSMRPYFLTANHCVSTQAHARTMVTYWDFQTQTCGGAAPNRRTRPSTQGARLLATAGMGGGDYTLLLLDQNAPGNRTYLGWSARDIAIGAPTAGIHHPGSPPTNHKRITFGVRTPDRTVVVDGETAPAALYWQIRETEGRTEQGSSGSPLLNNEGLLIGILSNGPVPPRGQSYCDIQGSGGYGRFANAFESISQYLNDQEAPSLSASVNTLTFSLRDGIASPSSQRFEVRTSSQTPVMFSVSSGAPWLRVASNSGASTANVAAAVIVSIDALALTAPGTFEGIITITSGSLAPINIAVRANVGFSQSAVVITINPNPVYQSQPDEDGFSYFYTLRIDETSGVPARITGLRIDGVIYDSEIFNFFETDLIPAFGGVGVSLRGGIAAPRRRSFVVSGVSAAGGAPWSAALEVDFLARPNRATISLTAIPREVARNESAPADCRWSHELIVQEATGYSVRLNRFFAADFDLSTQIESFFGSTLLRANGLLRTSLCWREVGSVPRNLNFEIGGTDERGNAVNTTATVRMVGTTTSTATLAASVREISERGQSGSEFAVRRTFRVLTNGDALWTLTPAIGGLFKDWINVNPQRGRGPTEVTVTFDPYYLPLGSIEAHLVVESGSANPQFVSIPVRFDAFAPTAGPPRITAVLNGASFRGGPVTPGSWVTIFGENLASTPDPGRIWRADEIMGSRLPFSLDGTSVTFNGRAAAIYFVSSRQLNVQAPDEPSIGPVTVEVAAGGGRAASSVVLARAAPTLFEGGGAGGFILPAAVDTSGRLIGSPQVIPGSRAAIPGEIISVYGTGFGPIVSTVPSGTIPPGSVALQNPVTVRIGGLVAQVTFAGLVGAGLNQINIRIPELPPGNHLLTIETGGGAIQPNIVIPVLN